MRTAVLGGVLEGVAGDTLRGLVGDELDGLDDTIDDLQTEGGRRSASCSSLSAPLASLSAVLSAPPQISPQGRRASAALPLPPPQSIRRPSSSPDANDASSYLVLDTRVFSLRVLTNDDRVDVVVRSLESNDGAARADVGKEGEGAAEDEVERDVALSDCARELARLTRMVVEW